MNVRALLPTSLAIWLLAGTLPLAAQDTVPISRERLEELERKAAELDRIKGDLNKAKQDNERLKQQVQHAATNTPVVKNAAQVVAPPLKPLTGLPALSSTNTVDAIDLAGYYAADQKSADERFKGRSFYLKGEIAGFEKRAFARGYTILFKTAQPDSRLSCEVYPPEDVQPVFTAKHGTELMSRSKTALARKGQVATVHGECKGLRDGAVEMSGCALKSIAPGGGQ